MMKKIETLEDFYLRKEISIPSTFSAAIGHFNLFKLDESYRVRNKPLPYKRRDYYKIMLVIGNIEVHYADKVVEVQQQALVFSNPQIPYKCEYLENIQDGAYCIFNQHFFSNFGHLNQYSVFQPNGKHVFELDETQVTQLKTIYQKMFEEFNSDYIHKYDVLRNLVFELLHFAMKLEPSSKFEKQPMNAAQRITTLFLELLERQFPIDETHLSINLRTPSDFAQQLNVHINHLNRAVKETTDKTTSQHITERILQEAQILLKHSSWNIAEIAYALGFSEVTHFNNFFKKNTQLSPTQFRVS